MNEYLSKPVSPADLEAALGRVTGAASAHGQPQGATAEPAGQVLDWTELLAKARGNTGFLMKLFGAFVAEQPGNLAAMQSALDETDLAHLAFLAHSLKGAAATMCAPALRDASHELERAARAGELPRAAEALAALAQALHTVLAAMRTKLAAG